MIDGNCFQKCFDKVVYCTGLSIDVEFNLNKIKNIIIKRGFPDSEIENNKLFKNINVDAILH